MVLCNMCKGVVIPPPRQITQLNTSCGVEMNGYDSNIFVVMGDRLDGCHWNKDLTKVQA